MLPQAQPLRLKLTKCLQNQTQQILNFTKSQFLFIVAATNTTTNGLFSHLPFREAHRQHAIATLEAFLTRLSRHVHCVWANRRPWTELIDRTAITRPQSLAEATSRIRKNLYYFRVNYLLVLALVLAVSLLSHPLSLLLLIALIGAWLFLYILRPSDQQLVIFGRSFTDCEALIGLILVTVVMILLTSVVSLLVSAFALGLTLVFVHGAFRVPDDLFLDQQDPWASGLFPSVRNSRITSSLGIPVAPGAV